MIWISRSHWIVDVETAEKEIAQDYDENYLQGEVYFTLQLLYFVLPSYRLMGMCRWIEWHFHDQIDYEL